MFVASPHLLFCRSFMISDLTFQSLVHYELILGNGIKYRSNFIFLHVFLWVSQQRLTKRLCFPRGVSLALLLGLSWCGGFIMCCLSVPLVCVSSFMPVPDCFICALWYSLKSGSVMLCSSFSCLLWVFGVFCGSITNFRIKKKFSRKYHWNLNRDRVKSIDDFGKMNI